MVFCHIYHKAFNQLVLNFYYFAKISLFGKHIFFLDSFGNFTLSLRFKCKYTHLTVDNIYIEHSSYDFTKDKFVWVDVELHPHGIATIFKKCIKSLCIKLNYFLVILLSLSDLFPWWI